MIEQLMIYHHFSLGKMYVYWNAKLGNGNQQQSQVDVQNPDHTSFNSQMDHQKNETGSKKKEQQKHPEHKQVHLNDHITSLQKALTNTNNISHQRSIKQSTCNTSSGREIRRQKKYKTNKQGI